MTQEQLTLSLEAISKEINELHGELCAIGKIAIDKAIRIGELLVKARNKLRHGKWLPWLNAKLEFSQRTAYNYIGLFEGGAKFANIANLTEGYALQIKDAEKRQKAEERATRRIEFQQRLLLGGLQNGTLPLPGPFEIILADPPWRYQGVTTTPDRVIEQHYATCTVEEICTHCPDSGEDAILFLWATAPLLPEALQVMNAWGFGYKTNAVWIKKK